MLQQAADELNIDLSRSFVVGDKPADVDAGKAVGCQTFLVLTGYGKETAESYQGKVRTVPDVSSAVEQILL